MFRLVVTRFGSLRCNNRRVPRFKASERKVTAGVTNIFRSAVWRDEMRVKDEEESEREVGR